MAGKSARCWFFAASPQIVPQIKRRKGVFCGCRDTVASDQRNCAQFRFRGPTFERRTPLINQLAQRRRQAQHVVIDQHRWNDVVHRRNGPVDILKVEVWITGGRQTEKLPYRKRGLFYEENT